MTPTQRSKKLLESRGYRVAIVEHWNSFARIRQDLFGFIDLLALRDGETLGVQTTSASNMSVRIKKIADHENVGVVREAGWGIHCHGWRKNAAGKWVCREVDLS